MELPASSFDSMSDPKVACFLKRRAGAGQVASSFQTTRRASEIIHLCECLRDEHKIEFESDLIPTPIDRTLEYLSTQIHGALQDRPELARVQPICSYSATSSRPTPACWEPRSGERSLVSPAKAQLYRLLVHTRRPFLCHTTSFRRMSSRRET